MAEKETETQANETTSPDANKKNGWQKLWSGCKDVYNFTKKYVPQLREIDEAIKSGDAERMVVTGVSIGGKYVKGDIGKALNMSESLYDAVRGNDSLDGRISDTADAANKGAQILGANSNLTKGLGLMSRAFQARKTALRNEAVIVNGVNQAIEKCRETAKLMQEENITSTESPYSDIPATPNSTQNEQDIRELRGLSTTNQSKPSTEDPAQVKEETTQSTGSKLSQLRFTSATRPRPRPNLTQPQNMTYRPTAHTH